MKILIIGCGYVGSAAASFWKKKGYSIGVATRTRGRLKELNNLADQVFLTEKYNADFFNDILEGYQAVLLSMAPQASTPALYQEAYLDVSNVLTEALQNNSSVKNILYTGSTKVYGDRSGNLVDETAELKAEDPFMDILIKTEEILAQPIRQDLHSCIFRLAGIYGPGRMIAERIKHLNGGLSSMNGESYINLIYLDDIINALDFALMHNLKGFFNLANDLHPKRKDLYKQICARDNLPEVKFSSSCEKKENKIVSNEKMKSLGFSFSSIIP